MGVETGIGWTDHTFNPWWGCERVSAGCQHCYAETFAKRTGHHVWGGASERRFFGDKHWNDPIRWNAAAEAAGRPALVFCASMADVFEDRDDLIEHRARLFELIAATPWLRWQLLTKRPENVAAMVPATWNHPYTRWNEEVRAFGTSEPIDTYSGTFGWPPNAWIGTTVEDQRRADERVPVLLELEHAPVRFLSCEPLLGPVKLRRDWLELELQAFGPAGAATFPRIDWVIVGGESGPGHRPMNLAHARGVILDATEADVPVFFKQVGGRTPKAGGDEIDYPEGTPARRIQQFPHVYAAELPEEEVTIR